MKISLFTYWVITESLIKYEVQVLKNNLHDLSINRNISILTDTLVELKIGSNSVHKPHEAPESVHLILHDEKYRGEQV